MRTLLVLWDFGTAPSLAVGSPAHVPVSGHSEWSTRRRFALGAFGNTGLEGERVVLVRHPWMQMEFDRDAAATESLGEVEAFIAEDVELSDLDGRRRVGRSRRSAGPVQRRAARQRR